jgi:hypothetical protein
MLQQSGPGNTPCLGWRLKILWPAFRRIESPRQSGPLSAPLVSLQSPRARNGIFAARDKAAKSTVLPTQRPVGAYQTSQDAANAAFSREVSESAKFRECVVGEPVRRNWSPIAKFPVNGEIQGSFLEFSPSGGRRRAKKYAPRNGFCAHSCLN